MSIFNNISQDFYNNLNSIGNNPVVLVILIFIIIIYYILFAFLGKSSSYDDNNYSTSFVFIEALLWGLFIILIFVNGLSYFFNVNIITEFKDVISNEPKINIKSTVDVPKINTDFKEVYHIPGNRFTYHDAKAVCKAFDGEMATYDQLVNAHQKGASWCSYGWTKDQLGLYPTSQSDWRKLQEKEGHEYDCGLPGINGGYVENTHRPLGANCYGVKPKQSILEIDYLKNKELYPKTQKEYLFDERVKYWKNRIGNILISPFNNDNWFKVPNINMIENQKMLTQNTNDLHQNYFKNEDKKVN